MTFSELNDRIERFASNLIIARLKGNTSFRVEFYESLLDYMKNGFEAPVALKKIADSYTDESGKNYSVEKLLYDRIQEDMAAGLDFNHVLAEFLPEQEALLITTAPVEQFNTALSGAVEMAKRNEAIKKVLTSNRNQLLGASVLLSTVLAGVGMYVFPIMEEMVPVEEWLVFVRYFYDFAKTFPYWGSAIYAYLVLLFIVAKYSLPRSSWPGSLEGVDGFQPRTLLNILPGGKTIANYYDQISMAILFQILSTLIKSRMDTGDSLNIIKENDQREYVQKNVKEIEEMLGAGMDLPAALSQSELVPKDVKPIVRRYGDLESALGEKLGILSDKSASHVLNEIQSQGGKLSSFMQLFAGLSIALASVSLILMSTVKA